MRDPVPAGLSGIRRFALSWQRIARAGTLTAGAVALLLAGAPPAPAQDSLALP